jgi:two-component system NtrC family sensor kinase
MSFSVMAILFVILAGLGVWQLQYFETSYRQLIAEQQSTLVRQIAGRIDTQLRDARDLVAAIAGSFPIDSLHDADLAQAYLDTQLGLGTTTLFNNGIFLFTADGRLLAEYPYKPDRRGRDYAFRKYFQDTVNSGRSQISDPYISSQSHQHPAINFTAPILAGGGEILAVIAGSVDLTRKNFLGGLNDVHIGRTGYLYLYNTDRLIIMHPDQQRIMKHDVPLGANVWFDRAIQGFEGTEETVNSRGLHTLVTFKRLNDDHWILAANYPTAEAFAPIVRAQHFFTYSLATILLIAIVVTWGVTRALLAPLLRLTEHVAGFSSVAVAKSRSGGAQGDEIDTLALTFDALMAQVAEQRQTAENRLAFLQGIIDTIPHPTFYKDLAGRFLGCNSAMQTLCGKPLEQIIGTTIDEHFPPETTRRLNEGDHALLQGESRLSKREIEMTLGDGENLCTLVYKALLKDGQGSPQGVVNSVVDISDLKKIETALADEREFTFRLLQHSATPCFVITPEHKVLIWTRALEELTGLKAAEVLDTNQHWRAFYAFERPCLADIIMDQNFDAAIDYYNLLSNSALIQDGIQAEGWRSLHNGKSRYLTFAAAPIHDRNGKLVAVIETLHDLTNLKRTEEALRETQISYHALVDSSPDAILVHRQGTVLYANQAANKLLCVEQQGNLAGRLLSELIHPSCHDSAFKKIAEIESKQSEQLYTEKTLLRFDGATINVEVGWSLTYYQGEAAVQSVMRDITVRKAAQELLWQQANFDSLTGLPNRSLFLDRFEQAINRCKREGNFAGLLYVDLDQFKDINDTLGHASGDELLRQVARRMSDCLRLTETVARLGGDEFTIILPVMTGSEDATIAAERLLEVLQKPFTLPGGTGQISCSIGIAICPRDGQGVDELMRVADASMYQVKRRGRNGYALAETV